MHTLTANTAQILGYPCEVIRAQFDARPFERHFHDTFAIGIVRSGVNAFSYRGKRIAVPAGAICIADPGEVHDGGLTGKPWSYTNISVAPELLAAISSENGEDAEPVFEQGTVTDRVTCSMLAGFFETLFVHAGSREAIDEAAISVFGRLLNSHSVARTSSPAHNTTPIADRAIEIMNDCHGCGISLGLLARETGASRYQVIRAVHASIGLTPTVYMIQLRVERAKELIQFGMPLADAALESGFADQSHLTRAMQARLGITPARLRKSGMFGQQPSNS